MKTFKEYLNIRYNIFENDFNSFEYKGISYTCGNDSYIKTTGNTKEEISYEDYKKAYERHNGSRTATVGYEVEKLVSNMFNSNDIDKNIQSVMGIDTEKSVSSHTVGGRNKSDIVVSYTNKEGREIETGVSIKFVKNPNRSGYNQIYRNPLSRFNNFFDNSIPDETLAILEKFLVKDSSGKKMKMTQFNEKDQKKVLNWLNENKKKILNYVFAGDINYGTKEEIKPSCDYILTVYGIDGKNKKIEKISDKIKTYDDIEWTISPRGSLSLGDITLQRKGGDGGRITANDLQFKIKIPKLKEE